MLCRIIFIQDVSVMAKSDPPKLLPAWFMFQGRWRKTTVALRQWAERCLT